MKFFESAQSFLRINVAPTNIRKQLYKLNISFKVEMGLQGGDGRAWRRTYGKERDLYRTALPLGYIR